MSPMVWKYRNVVDRTEADKVSLIELVPIWMVLPGVTRKRDLSFIAFSIKEQTSNTSIKTENKQPCGKSLYIAQVIITKIQ